MWCAQNLVPINFGSEQYAKFALFLAKNCSCDSNLALIPIVVIKNQITNYWVKSYVILLCLDQPHTQDNKDLRDSANDAYVHGEEPIIH